MKKLMMAAAVFAVALGTQAACVDWGNDTNIKDPATGNNANQFAAYYFAQSATEVSGSETFLLRDTLISMLQTDDYLDVISQASGNDIVRSGSVATSSDDVFAEGPGKNDDNIVTGYLVVFNAATAADATKAFVSELGDCAIDQYGSCPDGIYFDMSDTADGTKWVTVGAVPEPTSGLLLLLGVAGLALRRRRA